MNEKIIENGSWLLDGALLDGTLPDGTLLSQKSR
jgi:hypothetical protein